MLNRIESASSRASPSICLLTDFGVGSPYVGQMKSVLAAAAPSIPVVDLISDLPAFRTDLVAYLLPALIRDVPAGAVFCCVVDPGVGTERRALAVEADGRSLVGPDNGLLAIAAQRATSVRVLRIDWRPERLSDSFHGRDIFAPVAARLALGEPVESSALAVEELVGADWPDQLPAVVYSDVYGNLLTGLTADHVPDDARFSAVGCTARFARTFGEAPPGEPFWHRNAFGLVEIAFREDSAAKRLGLGPGDPVLRIA